MMECGKTTLLTGKELSLGKMGSIISETGKMTRSTVRDRSDTKMAVSTKVSFLTISNTVTESTNGPTARPTTVNGSKINTTEKLKSRIQRA